MATQAAAPQAPGGQPVATDAAAAATASGDSARGFDWVVSLAAALAPLLRPHRMTLLWIGLLMTIELGLQLGQRKAFSTLLDDAIIKGQVDLLVLILILLAVAALFSGAAGMLHEYLQARLCASVPGEVRARLFEHTQRWPLSRLRTSTPGDMITRITSDAGSVEPALWSIGYIAAALCGVVISFGLLLWTDWQLALIGMALMPLALIGPRLLTPRAARESYAAKTGVGALATHMQENLANQIVLRVFGLGKLAQQRFASHNERIIGASRRYNVLSYFSHRVPWIAIELIDRTGDARARLLARARRADDAGRTGGVLSAVCRAGDPYLHPDHFDSRADRRLGRDAAGQRTAGVERGVGQHPRARLEHGSPRGAAVIVYAIADVVTYAGVRRYLFRRPAPAHRPCPRTHLRAIAAGAGRTDQRPRPGYWKCRDADHAAGLRRAHGRAGNPPAARCRAGCADHRVRSRPGCRIRYARLAARGCWHLCGALARAARAAGVMTRVAQAVAGKGV